jgi:hypothetical protein
MARKALSAKTVRSLAPVLVPLVTRIVLPLAVQSLRRGKLETGGVLDDARDSVGKSLKKTRSELDDVRQEAIARGLKLVDEAKRHGTELLDMIAAKGAGVAEEWVQTVRPRRRRRFGWGKALLLLSVVGFGIYAYNRLND